jgi:hypothetical protein
MLAGKMKLNRMVSVTLVAGCALTATAADLVNLSVEIDGWTMMPIAENGATTHIIAARNDDETLTTDIDVVLYEKTATGWSGWAYYPSVTKEDAMIDIADEFGLSDPFGGEWHIELDQVDVLDHVMPRVGFGKGFFMTDPLYQIADAMDDPEPLAEAAEDGGMAAGSGAANTGSFTNGGTPIGDPSPIGDCGCDACIQTTIASRVDQFYNQQLFTLADASQSIVDDLAGLMLACCWPSDVSSTTNGLWSCGPWGPPTRTDSSSIGSDNCLYERTVTRTRYKFGTIVCFDCTRLNYSQTCTETGTQTARTTVEDSVPCPVAGPDPADEPTECRPYTGVTHTAWAPPKPTCP